NMRNSNQMVYEFGKDSEKISKEKEIISQLVPHYISSSRTAHGLKIVSSKEIYLVTETAEALTAGIMLHDTMANIYTESDAERVLTELEERAIIPKKELDVLKKTVTQIIQHPNLKKLFGGTDKVYNERSIITKDGLVLRPDRININSENVSTLIDYKTGSPTIWHSDQLIAYANALQDMGFVVSEKMLIYSNEDEIIINKV